MFLHFSAKTLHVIDVLVSLNKERSEIKKRPYKMNSENKKFSVEQMKRTLPVNDDYTFPRCFFLLLRHGSGGFAVGSRVLSLHPLPVAVAGLGRGTAVHVGQVSLHGLPRQL